ncbi:MAG TPA: RNA 2',3'-cyclic phosphodiesterase [Stellaceae bacterium]|nr:RNA 2',3'-cyclic phosphodiesterase [Stellaceae bacterium]
MVRLFVGIDLPPEIKLRLEPLCLGLPGAKWVDAGNFHVTLRFIGEVDEALASDIDASLSRLRSPGFSLSLAGVDCFGSADRPRVLHVKVEPTIDLTRLHDKVAQAVGRAGVPPDGQRFTPHVTLARLKPGMMPAVQRYILANALFRLPPFPIDRFSLVSSVPTKAGAIYEAVSEYPLG